MTQINEFRAGLRDARPMERRSQIFERFERSFLPRDLAPHRRDGFASLGRSHSLEAGMPLQICTMTDALVFVGQGAIKLVAHASAEREQIVAFYFPGDLLTVPADGTHSYSLYALQCSDLLVFPYPQFLRHSQGEPKILEHLLNRHALSLQRSREKTIALGRKTASERLASFLLAMAERVGKSDGSRIVIDLPMSRGDIADSLGLTIETVSRQFSKMRASGLVETQGRSRVVLRSLDAVAQCSGGFRSAA